MFRQRRPPAVSCLNLIGRLAAIIKLNIGDEMTPKQKIEIRLSENRQSINALLEKGDLTEEDRAELDKLTKANKGIETEYRGGHCR